MSDISVIGNLGADAEVRDAGGTKVVSFRIAETKKDKNGEHTAWYQISCFGSLVDGIMQYLVKGKQVSVRGDLFPREYEHKGEKRTSLDVRADKVRLLGGGKKDGSAAAPTHSAAPSASTDDIPF